VASFQVKRFRGKACELGKGAVRPNKGESAIRSVAQSRWKTRGRSGAGKRDRLWGLKSGSETRSIRVLKISFTEGAKGEGRGNILQLDEGGANDTLNGIS